LSFLVVRRAILLAVATGLGHTPEWHVVDELAGRPSPGRALLS
jgi:hypothetical protein